MFRVSSIKIKILCLNFIIAVGMVAFLMFFYLTMSDTLEKEKMRLTKSKSESAMGGIQFFYDLSVSGEMEVSKAKEYAKNALQSATFGKHGYFWINSGEGVLLMQPYTPEMLGSNQIDWKYVKGQYIFRNFIEKARAAVAGKRIIGPSQTARPLIRKSPMFPILNHGIG